MNMKIKSFTLAEVLITLGIIGIVAAMTLPIVIGNYKKQVVSSRLKKFYSIMNQAILMSENDNESIEYWDFYEGKYNNDDGNYDYNLGGESSYKFFNRYLAKYIKFFKIEQGFSKEDENGNTINQRTKIYFYDGSTAELKLGSCQDIIFDINGLKKPNKIAEDQFWFLICPARFKSIRLYDNEKISTYSWTNATTREVAIDACKSSRAYCGRLLQIDNWEIKSDYPYKI